MSNEQETHELIATLDRHRGFLLHTADGLTEEQSRTRSTVSRLTVASILKHVADTEETWLRFAVQGPDAFAQIFAQDTGWGTSEEQAPPDEQRDPRFVLDESDTLDALRHRIGDVAATTTEVLTAADLDASHPLPPAPWFEPGARWSVRRVALHMIAEISQHAGHADIIREAIDGQRTMG